MGDHRTLDEFVQGRSEDDPETDDEAVASAGEEIESADEEIVSADETLTSESETVESEAEQPGPIVDGSDSEIEESDMPGAESPSRDDGAVEPPATTYRWRPEGVTCEGCGAVVERQWRDSGEFVCVDCKDW